MTKGKLILVPTPIDEESKLNIEAFNLIAKQLEETPESTIIVVEDLKPARRRWINFGLNRDAINSFHQLNEHNKNESTKELIEKLKAGFTVFVMSDGGLPAFCDPGKELVYAAHKNKIKVTSTPFFNSVILALALSGLSHQKFYFGGFLSKDDSERKAEIKAAFTRHETTILMDTPYRLKRVLEESAEFSKNSKREVFLAIDLNNPNEELFLESPETILRTLSDFKREFILVIAGKNA